jgi:hypothetical protein
MADDPQGSFNSMQAAAGLMPPFSAVAPQIMFPGQASAMIAQGSLGALMGGFQQPFPTYTGGPMMMPGAGGVMMPMSPGGPSQAFGGPLGGMGPMTPPSIYSGYGQMAGPPAYRGGMGQPPNLIAPQVPSSFFNTPFQAGYAQQEASSNRLFAMDLASRGAAARTATDFGAGMLGAGLGYHYGGAKGAIVGGVAGFLGSELGGLGQAGQNAFMNNFAAPAANMRAFGAGIESMSQGFVAGGAYGSVSGSGFSRSASIHAARQLEDLSNSDDFQRQTFGRFNTSDVMRITQGASQNGLMQGVQSPDAMRDRVRDVARQLQSFMELANEPDLQRAIQTMGNMRMQGMNAAETMQAVNNGRTFARMAGTTFENVANVGGGQGASTFGSMGLSQGLGAHAGMANYALAAMGQNLGIHSPSVMNMLGGVGGMANMNNMFSAGVLQMPMLAPGMMNSAGGLNAHSIQALQQGRTDPMSMTSAGSTTLGAMTQQMGIGGLGMAVGMQPILQDAIGRTVQGMGPFAQRNMDDRQVLALARRMNLHGSEGYMTAAQMMGANGTQAYARAQELSDPRYYDRMRDQIEVRRQEGRAVEERDRVARQPGVMDELAADSGAVYNARMNFRGLGRGVRNAYESFAGGNTSNTYNDETAWERRATNRLVGSRDYLHHVSTMGSIGAESEHNGFGDSVRIAEAEGARGITAAIGGVGFRLGTNRGERAARIREIQDTGRFTAGVLNTSRAGVDAANARLDDTFFGSAEARDAFSTRVASRYNRAEGPAGGAIRTGLSNLAVRAGVDYLTNGVIDPGNVAGNRMPRTGDFRQDYINSTRKYTKMSEGSLGAHFDEHASTIAAQASSGIQGALTDVGRSRMGDSNAAAHELDGRGQVDTQGNEVQAYRGLLAGGADSATSRRAFDRVNRMFGEGFGRNEADRTRSRQLMTALAVLNRRMQNPRTSEEASRQRDALKAEMRRRGMSDAEVNRADQTVAAHASELGGVEGFDEAARGANIGGSASEYFSRVGATEGGARQAHADTTTYRGVAALGGMRGALGDIFRGAARGGTLHMEEIGKHLETADAAQLDEQSPELARAVRRYQSSTDPRAREAALQQVVRLSNNQGERVNRLERRGHELGRTGRAMEGWQEGHGLLGGLEGAVRGALDSDLSYAVRRSRGGTASDDRAMRESGDVDAMQRQAEGAGMGGSMDRLAEVTRNLEEVTRNLSQVVSSQALGNLHPNGD